MGTYRIFKCRSAERYIRDEELTLRNRVCPEGLGPHSIRTVVNSHGQGYKNQKTDFHYKSTIRSVEQEKS